MHSLLRLATPNSPATTAAALIAAAVRAFLTMKFRPCIDLHDGVVKQIVGSTLRDGASASAPVTNFVATKSAAEYARSVCVRCPNRILL